MAAGRSLRTFYAGLALVAVVGALVIMRSAGQRTVTLNETSAPVASGPRGIVLGSDSAKVEIMEFSDFECPWCGRFAVLQMPDIRQRLTTTGRVRWRFLHFPLFQIHKKSPYAHLAAACANEQGKFWEMQDIIYQNQEDWVNSDGFQRMIDGYAERVGVDKARYNSCISERRAWGQVLADKKLGDSLGLDGTPTFFVNGHLVTTTNVTTDLFVRMVDSIAPARPAASSRSARAPR
jgi:protein-disulfide isomerase